MVGYDENSKRWRFVPIGTKMFNEVAKEYIEIDVSRNNPVSNQRKEKPMEQSQPGTSTATKSKVTQEEFFTP
ncbi:hypothetical protein O9G_005677, partial [Rozella allomycis CSF55]